MKFYYRKQSADPANAGGLAMGLGIGAFVFTEATESTISCNDTKTLIRSKITAKTQKRGQP